MKYQDLLENLNNPKVKSRQASVYVLGMVDEVRAITAFRKRYARETNRQVKMAMQTVGGQLAKLKGEGYDTIEAIFETFDINKELRSIAGEDDDKKIKNIQQNSHHNEKDDDRNEHLLNAASGLVMLSGTGGTSGMRRVLSGLSGMINMNSANVDMTSGMNDTSDFIKKMSKRTPPVRPTDDNISMWVEKLMFEEDPDKRIDYIIQIGNMHNIAALPYLADIYWTDSDERVKQTAKRFGKTIYLNNLYWDMTQDGSIQKIIEEKAAEMGITIPEENTIEMERPAHNPSIDDILSEAEKKRNKKQQ